MRIKGWGLKLLSLVLASTLLGCRTVWTAKFGTSVPAFPLVPL